LSIDVWLIIPIALVLYFLLYFGYGRFLERKVVKVDAAAVTPAHRLYDGIDYVPSNKFVIFGHHFASIAGAGPILGPTMAMAWGWIPAFLWVIFGNALIGAVHDYLSLMASVRYDGKSVAFVAEKAIRPRTRYIFSIYIWFALVLVVAAFIITTATAFVGIPESATPSILFCPIALLFGIILYRVGLDLKVSTVIGLFLVFASVWVGYYIPLPLAFTEWVFILSIYAWMAAFLPVWYLLQPRDYLNAYLLWFGLGFGGIALLLAAPPLVMPAFTSFTMTVVGGKPSPWWPTVVLVIACGALSGFHSLVSSGTSSKQIDKETDALFIGYGGMFFEGFLSVIVVASLGAYLLSLPAAAGDLSKAISYAVATPLPAFTGSYGLALNKAFGIAPKIGAIFATLWVSAFVLTTLDTANRLARFVFVELMAPVEKASKGAYRAVSNRIFASLLCAVVGGLLAGTGAYTYIWPAFAGTNQLLAALAMMTVSAWVVGVLKLPKRICAWILVPTIFLLVTVTVALFWYLFVVAAPLMFVAGREALGVSLTVISVIMLVLDILLIADFSATCRKHWAAGA